MPSICDTCAHAFDCLFEKKGSPNLRCPGYHAAPGERCDTELAVLKAQVSVLLRWACCPRASGAIAECPTPDECDCRACTERVSRRLAEKEVQG